MKEVLVGYADLRGYVEYGSTWWVWAVVEAPVHHRRLFIGPRADVRALSWLHDQAKTHTTTGDES